MKNFRLNFNKSWYEYIVLGILLSIFGFQISKYSIPVFLPLTIILYVFGIFYFLRGVYMGIKKLFKATIK